MAPPPAKKPKADPEVKEEPREPIIFTAPGYQPDTGFHVFGQRFYVYSGALKIKSAFFRKFLEPSGGKPPSSTVPFLTSEWFTKIDDDGKSWALTSDSEFRNDDLSKFTGSTNIQVESFRKLLCAIFGRSYDINNCYELKIMTNHAEYYCCLPTLSVSLWGPLANSPELVPSISKWPCLTLIAAYKLRHKQLFNDCFIQVLGPWSNPRFKQLKDPELLKIATAAHAKMRADLLAVQQGIFKIFADVDGIYKDTGKVMMGLAKKAADEHGNVSLPQYFRLCFNYAYESSEGADEVKELLGPTLQNNLLLDKSKQAGQGRFKDFFLSFQVGKYPWDESQHHW